MKSIGLVSPWEPMTWKIICDKVPDPDTPFEPGTLLTILTVPWTPGGMNPQLVTGIAGLIEPSDTETTSITSGL